MNNRQIINLTDPTNNQDAATKNYVDTTSSTAVSNYLRLDGTSLMTGNLNMNNRLIRNLANPTLNTDAVNVNFLNAETDFEPPFIQSLTPYLHLVADAYSSTTQVYDLSSNNRAITTTNGTGGTISYNSNALNGHSTVTLNNASVMFPRTTSVFAAFIVMKYNPLVVNNSQHFIFGDSTLNSFDSGITTIFNNFASTSVRNNSYVNGLIQTNGANTLKPLNWFLYAYYSTTDILISNGGTEAMNSLGYDRNGLTNRYGNYIFSEVLIFTYKINDNIFNQITDYLLSKYGIQYNYYPNVLSELIPLFPNTTNYPSMVINFCNMNTFATANTYPNLGTINVIFTNSNAALLPSLNSNGLNGYPILSFNGSSQFLSSNVTQFFQAPMCVIIIARFSSFPGIGVSRRIFTVNGNLTLGLTSNSMSIGVPTVGNYVTSSTIINLPNRWYILVYRYNSNFSVDFGINGNLTYENITGTGNAPNTGTNTMFIGSSSTPSEYHAGDIAHISVFNIALSNIQIQEFIGQLAFQYGLLTTLPPQHPYRLNNPTIKSNSIKMNNNSITGLASSSDLNSAINLTQLNNTVNTLCNVSTGVAKGCLTTDGTNSMSGNLNMGAINRIINLSNPVNPQDAATKNYVDNIGGLKVFQSLVSFGSGTTNPSTKTLSMSNASFTATNVMRSLVGIPIPSTVFTDQFLVTSFSATFTFAAGTFTFTVTVVRTDNNTIWGQNLSLQVTLFYN